MKRLIVALAALVAVWVVGSCFRPTRPDRQSRALPAANAIVIAGRHVPIDVPVVRWDQADGFNGYRRRCLSDPGAVLPRRPARGCNTPSRFGVRPFLAHPRDPDHRIPNSRRTWQKLQRHITQIVLHYDATGSSRRCFHVLHDERGLSCHFLIDRDGTIYQTLDVAERARHASAVNDQSVGIELANIGAYASPEKLMRVADQMADNANPRRAGRTTVLASSARRDTGAARYVSGTVQGRRLYQYAYTDDQYRSLISLTRALRSALPRINPAAPADADGEVATAALPHSQRRRFRGIVGHHHVAPYKSDPGPAFDWHRYLSAIR